MGQLLFYESLGKGTPVVLLHGLALDHTIWYPVANLLKDEFHVVLPDLRGHGRSFSPPGRYSMDQMAEDMLQLVDYLNLERFFLGGHSMGGYVALNFAKNHPDRLLNLGLIASHIYADSTEKSEQRLQQIEKLEHESPAVIFSIMLHGLTRNETVRQFCDEII